MTGRRSATDPAALDRRDRRHWQDLAAQALVFVGGLSALLFLAAIFVFVISQGVEFALHRLDWVELLTSTTWRPTADPPQYGALALICGSLAVTAVALAVAVPVSLGAAIWVAEFARPTTREWLKIGIELLAAIPSVVWGMIGLYVLAPAITTVFPVELGVGLFNAGLLLGFMAAPILTTVAEDALRAVPDEHREAAEALGATRWQVVRRVVLPSARRGLAAALLLGIGRAFAETIVVLMASGHAVSLPTSLFDSVRTITATIAAELDETAPGDDHHQVLFVLGFLLLAITFAVNYVANRIVRGNAPKNP